MFKKFLIKHNIIKGNFLIDPFIYVDEKTKEPVTCSGCIKNLKPFFINCKYKDKYNFAFQMLGYKYPEYIGYFNIF